MKIKINSIQLVGAKRVVPFEPGLNVVTGPITTGKSVLMRCLRGLLGSGLQGFPREVRNNVSHLSGELTIGEHTYRIVRPFVTTDDARVEIAGNNSAERLPAMKPTRTALYTYGMWLLDAMGLPKLRVPKAPTKPDSELSPLSINDFMMYCILDQDEIDKSVFGHDNNFKNIKRQYVFDVVYGNYNLDVTILQSKLRDTYRQLHRYENQTETIEELLEDTPFSNRAKIELQIDEFETEIKQLESSEVQLAARATTRSGTEEIRNNIRVLEVELSRLQTSLVAEENSREQMRTLLGQLHTQANRLTRSIVAETYLLDFDFVVCPRCGTSISSDRTSDELCYLCLQTPTPQLGKKEFVQEHARLERQIDETEEIIDIHTQNIEKISEAIKLINPKLISLHAELDHKTKSFISAQAEELRSVASRRAELIESLKNLRGYLALFEKQGEAIKKIKQLQDEIVDLEAQIDASLSSAGQTANYFNYLDEQFTNILDMFRVPKFHNPGFTGINRKNYLPIVQGRPFSEFSSPGLRVMVNVAHALAHQLTAIHFDLILPNLLLIDGLSGNMGYKDLDATRIQAIYDYLESVADKYKDRLQIIVSDNSIPESVSKYIRLELSEEDKLIPADVLNTA